MDKVYVEPTVEIINVDGDVITSSLCPNELPE